jgi:hypothetical protein
LLESSKGFSLLSRIFYKKNQPALNYFLRRKHQSQEMKLFWRSRSIARPACGILSPEQPKI